MLRTYVGALLLQPPVVSPAVDMHGSRYGDHGLEFTYTFTYICRKTVAFSHVHAHVYAHSCQFMIGANLTRFIEQCPGESTVVEASELLFCHQLDPAVPHSLLGWDHLACLVAWLPQIWSLPDSAQRAAPDWFWSVVLTLVLKVLQSA